jgi:DNA-directed RNA polymerase subunit RPC12/RpoP
MYCYNCGKKIDEKAVVCVHCGVYTINVLVKKKTKGKSVASFVLGIIGIFYSFFMFINFLVVLFEGTSNFIINLICTCFIYGITIPGLCLSLAARKKEKNGLNTTGFILNLISIILSTIWLFFI